MDLRLSEKGAEFEFMMDAEAVRCTDVAAFVEQVDQAAEGYTTQLGGRMFETMNAVTQATGNIVDAGGSFSFEHLSAHTGGSLCHGSSRLGQEQRWMGSFLILPRRA